MEAKDAGSGGAELCLFVFFGETAGLFWMLDAFFAFLGAEDFLPKAPASSRSISEVDVASGRLSSFLFTGKLFGFVSSLMGVLDAFLKDRFFSVDKVSNF